MDIVESSDRELGILIRQYGEHREALRRLSATAPDGRLAERYERLVEGLTRTIDRLVEMQRAAQAGELEDLSMPLVDAPASERDPSHTSTLRQDEVDELPEDTDEREVDSGAGSSGSGSWDRPFVRDSRVELEKADEESSFRTPLILLLLIGVPVLLILIWMKATGQPESLENSAEQGQPAAVVEEAPSSPTIEVSPASHDYGRVRSGSRATSFFAIRNDSTEPLQITVDRSKCRCLWYDVPGEAIEPGQSARLTVTVDGGRAAGPLEETLIVRGPDSEQLAEIDIVAVVE